MQFALMHIIISALQTLIFGRRGSALSKFLYLFKNPGLFLLTEFFCVFLFNSKHTFKCKMRKTDILTWNSTEPHIAKHADL